MSKRLISILLIVVIGLTGCLRKTPEEKPDTSVFLADIGKAGEVTGEGAYDILDMRNFGFWSLAVDRDALAKRPGPSGYYTLTVNGEPYALKTNKLNANILECLLPEMLTEQAIEQGILRKTESPLEEQTATRESLTIAEVIIESLETDNGTNRYRIGVNNYIAMRNAKKGPIFDESGTFIRPSWVVSNELNTYTVSRFFDARQVSEAGGVVGAFTFLKNRQDHEELLDYPYPNRLQLTSGTIDIAPPDTRDRLRQLGTDTYTLEKDDANNQFIITINRNQLPAKYDDTHFWETQINEDGALFSFGDTGTADEYRTQIAYTQTANTEIVKNSRFSAVQYNPPDIQLQSPDNGQTNTNRTLTLEWTATAGDKEAGQRGSPAITGYKVSLAKAGSPYGEPATTTAQDMQKSGLDYNTEYKWKVTAVQNDGQETTSDEYTFKTEPREYYGPSITLDSPANNAEFTTTTVTFSWTARAGSQKNTGARARYHRLHLLPGQRRRGLPQREPRRRHPHPGRPRIRHHLQMESQSPPERRKDNDLRRTTLHNHDKCLQRRSGDKGRSLRDRRLGTVEQRPGLSR